MKNETKDLFESPELMPAELAAIFEGSEDGVDYSDLKVMLDKAKSIGYTFEYSLDAIPYELRKMTDAEIQQYKSDSIEVCDITLDGEKFEIMFDSYKDNGRLALWILGEDSDGMGSLLTVNLEAAPCGDRQAYINVNSMDTDAYQDLIDGGVIDAVPVSTFQSGYVIYPLHNILITGSKYQLT